MRHLSSLDFLSGICNRSPSAPTEAMSIVRRLVSVTIRYFARFGELRTILGANKNKGGKRWGWLHVLLRRYCYSVCAVVLQRWLRPGNCSLRTAGKSMQKEAKRMYMEQRPDSLNLFNYALIPCVLNKSCSPFHCKIACKAPLPGADAGLEFPCCLQIDGHKLSAVFAVGLSAVVLMKWLLFAYSPEWMTVHKILHWKVAFHSS